MPKILSTDLPAIRERFISLIVATNEKGCWLPRGKSDYGKFRIGGGVSTSGHRAAYELFVGPIPDKLCVLHECDVRQCRNPRHLFLGTRAENLADMVAKGRSLLGAKNARPGAKLTPEQVNQIRSLLNTGLTKAEIGRRFEVAEVQIRRIANGTAWSYIERKAAEEKPAEVPSA